MKDFHPVANLFPLVDGPEFDDLVADIRIHGLRVPIIIHDGQIIDGRNRARACAVAHVDPIYQTYGGTPGGVVDFIVSMNLKRRHLSTTERARIAESLSTRRAGGISSKELMTQDAAAYLLKISVSTIKRFRTVQNSGADDIIDAVDSERLSLAAAEEKLKSRRQPQTAPPIVEAPPPKKSRAAIEDRRKRIAAMAKRGYSSNQIAAELDISEETCRAWIKRDGIECRADKILKGTRRLNATRMMEQLVFAAEHLTADVGLIDFKEIDPRRIKPWIDQLTKARKSLSAFINHLTGKERANGKQANQANIAVDRQQSISGSDSDDEDAASVGYTTRIQ